MPSASCSPSTNRRGFLTHVSQMAAGAAAAVAARGLPAATQDKLLRMQMGLVTYLWGKDMTLDELLDACEKSGLLGVELRTEHRHGVEPDLTPAERQAVRRRFAASPVQLVGYGSNCEYHSADPAEVRANIEQTKRYIELMHDCGGTGVKVKPNGFPPGRSREATIEQIGKSLNIVAEYGQRYGQKIRVEVHGRGTSELPVIRDIFEVADHPNVYVCWNCNAEDLHGAGLAANFDMVKHRLGDTVHVREMNIGDYPYAQLMQMLVDMDYEGWILLEARTNPADKVAAMIEQRQVFERLTRAAR
ncbi:MAG: sugar phosphate isomerase/epimerase [Planctomycetota bacterium]|nr:MAG: sugar phosphate isomerase/epimerase [Planctomycetota bacterium]